MLCSKTPKPLPLALARDGNGGNQTVLGRVGQQHSRSSSSANLFVILTLCFISKSGTTSTNSVCNRLTRTHEFQYGIRRPPERRNECNAPDGCSAGLVNHLHDHHAMDPYGLFTDVPQQSGKPTSPDTAIVLQLTQAKSGAPSLAINHQPLLWTDLRHRLVEIYKLRADGVLFIKGDSDVDFEDVAQAIDTAHAANVRRVGLIP